MRDVVSNPYFILFSRTIYTDFQLHSVTRREWVTCILFTFIFQISRLHIPRKYRKKSTKYSVYSKWTRWSYYIILFRFRCGESWNQTSNTFWITNFELQIYSYRSKRHKHCSMRYYAYSAKEPCVQVFTCKVLATYLPDNLIWYTLRYEAATDIIIKVKSKETNPIL